VSNPGKVVYVVAFTQALLVVADEPIGAIHARVKLVSEGELVFFDNVLTMYRVKLHEGPGVMAKDHISLMYDGDRLDWEAHNIERWDEAAKSG